MLVRIANEPQAYAWGHRESMAALLRRQPSGQPEAELWLGAHPASPARVVGGDAAGTSLGTHLDAAGLPQPRILLKVLAAAEPLSLQVHPTTAQAREGFAREEAAGVPIDARERNYRDPFAKPELIVAMRDGFEALSGFRSVDASLAVVEALAEIDERVRPYATRLVAGAAGALEWLLSGDDDAVAAVAGVIAAAPQLPEPFARDADTVRRAAAAHPGDAGAAVALMLHRVSLAKGESISLPAGNLHAYLEGIGLELMEASDNVLRGGLTPKHVDVPELLRVVDATPIDDPLLPSIVEGDASVYRPAGTPFELRHVCGDDRVTGVAAIVLAMGPTTVTHGDDTLALELGEAAYATAGAVTVRGEDAWVALSRAAVEGV